MEERGTKGIDYQPVVEVDGVSYKIHLYGPSKAIKVLAELMKFIGEPIAAVAISATSGEDKMAEALPRAVKSLAMSMDNDRVLSLVKDLAGTAHKDLKPINFEDEFQGRLGHLFKLVAKVVEVQFGGFLGEIGQLTGFKAKA